MVGPGLRVCRSSCAYEDRYGAIHLPQRRPTILQYDDQRYTIVSSAASGCMCSQHRLPRGSNAGYAHGHARVHASLGSGGGKHGLISIRFSLSLWFHVHACTRVRLLQFGSFPWEACVFSHSLPERVCEGGTRNRVCARRHFSSVCFSAFRVRGGTHRLCHRLASAVRSSCSASSSTRTSRSRCSGWCSWCLV